MRGKLDKVRINRISEFLLNIFNIMKKDRKLKEGPEYQPFCNYLEGIGLTRIVKQIRFLSYLINSRHITDYSNILEVGSGYGLNLVILGALGFQKVTGIEIVEGIFYNSKKFVELIKESSPPFNMNNCDVVLGDAQKTNFKNSEFRNILCTEVISHVPSRDQFLREMNRILDLNGVLLISDGNNLDNILYKRKRLKKWKCVREKELLKRLNFIRENWPQLDPQYQATLAVHTELLSFEEIKNAVPIILSTGKLPMNLYFEGYAPTFAETGIWDEWGFYPKKLKAEITLHGFEVVLHTYYGAARGFPFSYLTSIANLCFPFCFKFLLSKSIIAYCIKKENCKYLVEVF